MPSLASFPNMVFMNQHCRFLLISPTFLGSWFEQSVDEVLQMGFSALMEKWLSQRSGSTGYGKNPIESRCSLTPSATNLWNGWLGWIPSTQRHLESADFSQVLFGAPYASG